MRPIFPGDYPDPSIVAVGGAYYAVHSSFEWAPGLLVFRSTDLVAWEPLGHALAAYDGDVWAPDIVHHGGRWYIYYKTTGGNHVVTADDPAGPWSAPSNVGIGWIDPGHVVDQDGSRWLHLSDGRLTRLSEDGLRAVGEPQRCIEPWPMPCEWPVEGVNLEGPKVFRHDGWWHYLAAQGGTAGPATSHMVLHARGPTPRGPWTWSPRNPVVHTFSREEAWWSVGHGSVVRAPDGRWMMLAHGYRRGFHTLGRQTLLLPVSWDAEGWLVADRATGDLAITTPGSEIDDRFAAPRLATHWRSWRGQAVTRIGPDGLHLAAAGERTGSSAPLCIIPGHTSYRIEADLVRPLPGCLAGLCLFYNPEAHHSIMVDAAGVWESGRAPWKPVPTPLPPGSRISLAIDNHHHEVRCWWRIGDGPWQPIGGTSELSGYHHNVFHGFLSLRAGLVACGTGEAVFSRFRYRGQDG